MDENFSLFNDLEDEEEFFEELSFFEKVQEKFRQLKEDFLHLPIWQKLALIITGSIFFAILFYTIFTFTRLSHIQKTSRVGKNTTLSNSENNQQNNQGQNNQNSNNQTTTTIPNQNTGNFVSSSENSQQLQETESSSIVGLLQNLVGGKTNSSSSTSQNTGGQNTQTTSVSNSQSQQAGIETSTKTPQQYIVNFLNGLLYFQDPETGAITPYILSGINPADFTWARYNNPTDGYSIDYPTSWTLVKRSDSGHEGLSLYPPTESPESNDAKQIGLGWSARYLLPTAGGSEIYYQTPITINNTLGQLFTLGGGDQGGRGTAVLLPHRFGYFGLGGSADTSEFIYVFQHMLASLTLTK